MFKYKKLYLKAREKDMNLQQLAEQSGIVRSGLYRKMNGQSQWTLAEMKSVCSALEVTEPSEIVSIFFLS